MNKTATSEQTELRENTAELKVSENFYLGLFDKIKILCVQEKESNPNLHVSYFYIFMFFFWECHYWTFQNTFFSKKKIY